MQAVARVFLVSFSLCLLAVHSPTVADDLKWVGYQTGTNAVTPLLPKSASFHHSNQWEGRVVPSPGDSAVFDVGNAVTDNGVPQLVYFGDYSIPVIPNYAPSGAFIEGGNAEVDQVQIRLDAFTFELDDQTLTANSIHVGSGEVAVNPGNPYARLTLRNGTVETPAGMHAGGDRPGYIVLTDGVVVNSGQDLGGSHIGSGSVGSVTVEGNSTQWNTTTLNIGGNGTGLLEVVSGGHVATPADAHLGRGASGVGTATISGAGSRWDVDYLSIGTYGTGSLTVEHGGTLNSNNYLTVGDYGRGTLYVRNGGQVGVYGVSVGVHPHFVGSRLLVDGGTLTTSEGWLNIGIENEAHGVVDIRGTATQPGLLEVPHVINVGLHGEGQMAVGSYGQVDASELTLGREATAVGNAAVQGHQSVARVSAARIGNAGVGNLVIANGGKFEIASYGTIGDLEGSRGSVTIRGSNSAWNGGNLHVGWNGMGELLVQDSASIDVNHATIGHSASAVGHVSIADGAVWQVADALSVGWEGHGSLNVDSAGTVDTKYLHVGHSKDAVGEVTVADPSTQINVSDYLTIGNGGLGEVTISDGATVNASGANVANEPGATGSGLKVDGGVFQTREGWVNFANHPDAEAWLEVRGTATNPGRLEVDEVMNIGLEGSATATVGNHSQIRAKELALGRSAGSSGALSAVGSKTLIDASNMVVGWTGQGEMEVSQSARVVTSNLTVGRWSSGNGMMSVRGEGTHLLSHERIMIGADGADGHLTLSDSAVMDGSTFYNAIGVGEGRGSVEVDSAIWLTNELHVGQRGRGTLNINDGTVSGVWATIGRYADAVGEVTVAGDQGLFSGTSSLFVGREGHGSLRVIDGGTVSFNGVFIGALFVGPSSGEALVDNATMNVADNLDVGYTDPTSNGQLTVANGGRVNVGRLLEVTQGSPLSIRSSGQVVVGAESLAGEGGVNNAIEILADGRLLGAGAIEGSVVNRGTVALESVLTELVLDGNFEQTDSGKLVVPFGLSDHAKLIVEEDAELGGHLELHAPAIRQLPAYQPLSVLSADEVTGRFDEVVAVTRYSMAVHVDYRGDEVVATLALPGDFNLDGTVNLADYTVWRDNLGSDMGFYLPEDSTPGRVDHLDYEIWRENFGISWAEPLAATQVPEPIALVLLMLSVVMGLLYRKRTR